MRLPGRENRADRAQVLQHKFAVILVAAKLVLGAAR